MLRSTLFLTTVFFATSMPLQIAVAGETPFPKLIEALAGAPPEGFTIGRALNAYNGSLDGSIYKMNLRTGEGEVLVPAEPDFDWETECYKLGMRVDPRSNYLIVAGCVNGDAYVFDADSGDEVMKYQLDDSGFSVINDLAITRDAVYFTDFGQPFLYRLPLSRNGRIPDNPDAAIAIPLTGDFESGDNLIGVYANGIVATPDGKWLIVGNSGSSKIFRVNPATGHSDEIMVDPPLLGLLDGSFLDGIVMYEGVLFILSPGETAEGDLVQVVTLSDDLLTGSLVGTISDSDMDGVASGAMHGDSLYVNNARYAEYPGLPTQYWVTRLNIYDLD
jgi:hypothetical protein